MRLALVPRTQKQMKSHRRKLRLQMRRHDESVRLRVLIQNRFDKLWPGEIKLRVARATLGEPYNHARLMESIVTCHNRNAVVLPLDRLALVTQHIRGASAIGYHVAVLYPLSRRWAKERKAVRHPKWRAR